MKKASLGSVLLAAMLSAAAAQAQFPSEVLGFEGPPVDDPVDAQEMFRVPQFSGTTRNYIVLNSGAAFDQNSAFRKGGLQSAGNAALEVIYSWVNPSDPNAWLRLTTLDGAERPNPALHTQGKVRFDITNISELFDGNIGVVIGVRETGELVPQLADGGSSGPIEWVGVDTTPNGVTAGADGLVDTTAMGDDIQVFALGADVSGEPEGTAVIAVGPNGVLDTAPAGDDVVRFGYFLDGRGLRRPIPAAIVPPGGFPVSLEFDLATGAVTLNNVAQGGGIAPFTGNGVLDATGDRGVLEHIGITNLSSDPATLIQFGIDQMQFEAPVPDPTVAPTIAAPVNADQTEVQVFTQEGATSAELFINGVSQGTQAPVNGVATFTSLVLQADDVLTARQTANGVTGPLSPAVVVFPAGLALADGFDSYLSQADLEQIWQLGDAANPNKVELTSGGAASCDNFVEINTLGGTHSTLIYDLGDVNGSDAEPLRFTLRFRHTAASGNVRGRFMLSPTVGGATGAVGWAFTNGVGGLYAEQYTTLLQTSDVSQYPGYEEDYFGFEYGLTGIAREENVWHELEVEVLSSVVNYYFNGVQVNGVDPNDPNTALYPGGVPRPNTGSFRYIVLGSGFGTNGAVMQFDDVAVTLGSAMTPFGAPNGLPTPTIQTPIFPNATDITLTDIDPNATTVNIYADDVLIGSDTAPFTDATTTITVAPLAAGARLIATQVIDGMESCGSGSLIVVTPAPTLEGALVPGDTEVEVRDVIANVAEEVTLFEDNEGLLTPIASIFNPTTDTVTFNVAPLVAGRALVATQTIAGVESDPSNAVEVIDSPINEWVLTSLLPFGVTQSQVVYLDGHVYLLGGRAGDTSGTRAFAQCFYAEVLPDGTLGAWVETATLPFARAWHGAAAANGRVYVWGGWDEFFTTSNECLYADVQPDGSLGPWTVSGVTIPDQGGLAYADSAGRGDLIWNDTLYLINGENNDGTLQSAVHYNRLDQTGDFGAWVPTVSTPQASWFHGVAIIDAAQTWIYRVAGNYGGTNESDVYRATIQPDGSLDAWTPTTSTPVSRYEHATVTLDDRWILFIGGLFGTTRFDGTFFSEVDPLTGELGDWAPALDFPQTVSRLTAVTYYRQGKQYVLTVGGGPFTGEPRLDECYVAQVRTNYFDLADAASFQDCYNPGTLATQGCIDAFDRNVDDLIGFGDYLKFERKVAGPDN